MPIERLTEIDEITRAEHYYLADDDTCYYFGEYTAKKGYSHSETNQLIINLKICPSKEGTMRWPHKMRAIQETAAAMRRSIDSDFIDTAVFIPVPPSKMKDHPLYDPRMSQVLERAFEGMDADVRELIIQTKSTEADHTTDDRIGFDDLYELYEIDEDLSEPAPTLIAVVDDVVTSGKHFSVAKRVLSERFPDVPIIGLFVARTIRDADIELWLNDLTK